MLIRGGAELAGAGVPPSGCGRVALHAAQAKAGKKGRVEGGARAQRRLPVSGLGRALVEQAGRSDVAGPQDGVAAGQQRADLGGRKPLIGRRFDLGRRVPGDAEGACGAIAGSTGAARPAPGATAAAAIDASAFFGNCGARAAAPAMVAGGKAAVTGSRETSLVLSRGRGAAVDSAAGCSSEKTPIPRNAATVAPAISPIETSWRKMPVDGIPARRRRSVKSIGGAPAGDRPVVNAAAVSPRSALLARVR